MLLYECSLSVTNRVYVKVLLKADVMAKVSGCQGVLIGWMQCHSLVSGLGMRAHTVVAMWSGSI